MNNKSNFRRGSVELLILHLLSQQDYYGYEISTLIREQTDGYLNIPVGSLYPALYKLIDAGYISDYKKQVGRRQVNVYYHLEDSGRTHLQQLLEDYYATANAIQQVLKYTVTPEEEGETMTKDKITDKYIKAVQKQFKHYHTTDARFISNLKDAVISYAAQQDSLDYEQLVSQFGDPQELVNDYFSEQSIDKQKKNVCFTWNIKTICIIITVFVLIFSAIYIYNINVQHKKELDTFIQKEVTILKEDPQ